MPTRNLRDFPGPLEIRPSYGPDYPTQLKELQGKSSYSANSAAKQLLEKMLVYYEVCELISQPGTHTILTFRSLRQNFITNVIVQVIERHIIDGLNDIFHTTELINMKEETVADIAAEDETPKASESYLDQKVADLRKAHNDCLGIAIRTAKERYEDLLFLRRIALEMIFVLTRNYSESQA
ncbi:hypothetical protein RRF57_011372 [Xylaria bambusicola]|uniref:GED domain-containing protein n=1 Tax=Xylaria bambusicola TaxID=326684 RepID=A0AAN7Z3L4_9PEZI